jgi:hypothetical protein
MLSRSSRHPSSSCHHHPNDCCTDVSNAEPDSPSDWPDSSSYAIGAATTTPTLTSNASADAADAQGQASGVHEGSSPCLCLFR